VRSPSQFSSIIAGCHLLPWQPARAIADVGDRQLRDEPEVAPAGSPAVCLQTEDRFGSVNTHSRLMSPAGNLILCIF
jgi:hypothetical protein